MGLHRFVHSTLQGTLLLLGTIVTAGAVTESGGQPTADRSPVLDAIIAANGGGFFPEILYYTGSGPVATDGEDGLPHINTRIGGPGDAAGVGETTITSACQPPAQINEEWGFWLVEDDFYGEHYERCDFFLAPEGFDEVQLSGFQVGFEGGFVTCSQAAVQFRVRVYGDVNGQPSSLLLDQTISAVGQPGEVTYAGTEVTRLYTWTLPLVQNFDIQRGWLSIQATGGGDCFVGQLTSAEGMDGHSLFKNGSEATWESQNFDLNYCLVSHSIAAPSCQPASTPAENWGFWLTDGAFGPRAERFQVDGLLESVTLTGSSVAWNGVSWQGCNNQNSTFHLTFYSDDNGSIGQPVASYTLNTAGESNGQVYYWTAPFFSRDYLLELPTPLNLRTGWVSVRAVASSGCWFAWLNSQTGDGSSLVWNSNTQAWRSFSEDFAFCTATVACPPVDQVNLSTFNGVITLDWLPLPNAVDYQVMSSKNPYGSFSPVEGTTGGATSYSVPMDGTMDFFKVVAICQ
jgi:hypothetical protein